MPDTVDDMTQTTELLETIAAAIENDPHPGLEGVELDAWNAATTRAAKVVRTFPSQQTEDRLRRTFADHLRRSAYHGDPEGYETFLATHATLGIDMMRCADNICRRAAQQADALLAALAQTVAGQANENSIS